MSESDGWRTDDSSTTSDANVGEGGGIYYSSSDDHGGSGDEYGSDDSDDYSYYTTSSSVTSNDYKSIDMEGFCPDDPLWEAYPSLPIENWMPFKKAMRRKTTVTAVAEDQQPSATDRLLPFAPKMIILPLEVSSNEAHVEQLLSVAGSKTQYIKVSTAILIQRHAKSHQMETVENHCQEDVVPLDNVYMAQVLICFPEKKESSESQRKIQEDWLKEVEALFKNATTTTTTALQPSTTTTTTGGDEKSRSEEEEEERQRTFFDFPCFTGSYQSYKLPTSECLKLRNATWETSSFKIFINWKYIIAPAWCFGALQMMCNVGGGTNRSGSSRGFKRRKRGPHLHPITRLDPGAFCHLDDNDDDHEERSSKNDDHEIDHGDNASEEQQQQDVRGWWPVVLGVGSKYRKSMMLTEAKLRKLDDSMDFETLEKVALLNPERGSSSSIHSGAEEPQKRDQKSRSLFSVLVLSQNTANPQRRMFLSPGLGLTAQVSPSKLHRFSSTSIGNLCDDDRGEKNSEKHQYFRQHPFSSLARNTFFSISDREAQVLVKFMTHFPHSVALCLSLYSSMMWYQKQPVVVANKNEDFVSGSSYAPDFVWPNRLSRWADRASLESVTRTIYFTHETAEDKICVSPTFTPDYYQGGRGFDRSLWMRGTCGCGLKCICCVEKPGGFNALISVLSFIPIPTLQRSVLGYSNSSDVVLTLWTAAVDEDHVQGFRSLVQHLHTAWSRNQRQQLARELRDLISRCILRGSLQVLATLLDICFNSSDELYYVAHHGGGEVEFDSTDIFRSIWVNDDGKSFKLLGRKVPRFAAKYLKPEHFWLAVRCGSVKIVSFITRMGAKVDLWSKKYGYLIESANNPDVLRLLLQAGGKPTLFVGKPTRSWPCSERDGEPYLKMGPTKLPLSTVVKNLCRLSATGHYGALYALDPHIVLGISAFGAGEWSEHYLLSSEIVPSQLVDRRDESLCWQREQKLKCFKVLEEFGVSVSDCVQAVVEDIGNPIGIVCESQYCSSKDHELIKFLAEKGGIGIQQVQDGVPKCDSHSSSSFLAEKGGIGANRTTKPLSAVRESLLHCACRGDLRKNTILTLLELGVEKNTLNERGESPYDVCAKSWGLRTKTLGELKFLKSQGFVSALQYFSHCEAAGLSLRSIVKLTGQSLPVVHAALQAFDGDPRSAFVSIVATLMIDEKEEEEEDGLGTRSMGSFVVSKMVKEEYLPQVRAVNATLDGIYQSVRAYGSLDSPQSWLDAYENLKEKAKGFFCDRGRILENNGCASEDEEELKDSGGSDDDDDGEDKGGCEDLEKKLLDIYETVKSGESVSQEVVMEAALDLMRASKEGRKFSCA